MKTWLPIGKVGRAQGLQGAFFVVGRDGALPTTLRQLRIGEHEASARLFNTRQVRSHGDKHIVQLQELAQREQVAPLIHQTIWAKREELGIGAEEWTWADLVGLPVVSADDVPMGEVMAVNNFGATDILEITDQRTGRHLAMPLADIYMDLSQCDGRQIKLLVNADTFAEAWEE